METESESTLVLEEISFIQMENSEIIFVAEELIPDLQVIKDTEKEGNESMVMELVQNEGQVLENVESDNTKNSSNQKISNEGITIDDSEEQIGEESSELVADMEMDAEENAQRILEDEGHELIDLEQDQQNAGDDENDGETTNEKLVQLPISKIRKIMKTDQDISLINREALFATTVLTEHFIAMLAQQSYKLAAASKKKTVNLNHVKSAITSSAIFDFLEGTLPQLDS